MSRWSPDRPYNELPPPPPAATFETRTTLKAAITAHAALAKLGQATRSMPNASVLVNVMPLLEAKASSEIENIVTTTDELFRHAVVEDNPDQATRETLRYRASIWAGYESISRRPMVTSTAEMICSTIYGREMSLRAQPGTRISNPSTDEVFYTPPVGQALIAEKMSDWERFVHAEDDLDPLIRMAVAHYQFEAIHPFYDGNGRTGRILNILMLIEAGLIDQPVLYLSREIIASKSDYYTGLRAVTADGAWEAWVLYMLTMVERSANRTLGTIAAMTQLQEQFARDSRAANKSATDLEFQTLLFTHPYCRIADVIKRCEVSRPTATGWLRSLVGAGLLQEAKYGREVLFINRKFIDLLAR